MAYSVEADLNLSAQRLIELTENDSAVGVKDSTLLAALHVRATDRITASLYGQYTIDDNDFPPILTEIESDLWRYYLYAHREVMEIPKTVQADYDWADELLERYRTRQETLSAAHVNAVTGPSPGAGGFSADSDDRVFGRAKDSL